MHRLLPAGRAKAPDELAASWDEIADSLTVMAGHDQIRMMEPSRNAWR